MEFLSNIFYSILLIGTGILILKYRRVVKSWTGNFVWAEHYLGRGSTYTVLIFFALFLIFFGIMYPFGGKEWLFGTRNEVNIKLQK